MFKGRIVFCVAALVCVLALPALAYVRGASSVAASAALSRVFTFFFLMLGPIKIVVPYARQTKDCDPALRRKLALQAFLISTLSLVIAASIGVAMLERWRVSIAALTMTAGVILFLVALQLVMKQYSPPTTTEAQPAAPSLAWVMSPMAFPTIVTPYGIAVLIVLVAAADSLDRQLQILCLALLVMVIDLFAMLHAHRILRLIGTASLQILGVVLGVLQVALGLDLIIMALVELGIAH